jgi:hypothetical protein
MSSAEGHAMHVHRGCIAILPCRPGDTSACLLFSPASCLHGGLYVYLRHDKGAMLDRLTLKLTDSTLHLVSASLMVACCCSVAAVEVDVTTGLQQPHGGKLVNLRVPADKVAAVKASATKTLEASDRNACDLELLTVG